MSLMGYGLDRYGLDAYGAEPTGMSISNAFAAGIRVVRVTLNREPKHISSTGIGDVLNPSTWMLQRLSDLAFLTPLSVAVFDPPYVYDIAVLEKLSEVSVHFKLSTTTLVTTEGGAILFSGSTYTFQGIRYSEDNPAAIAASKRFSARDLANPPAPNETQLSGTLQIVGNDYSLVDGVPLLKKLILRRLVTRPGEFFHLPNYGVGLVVKEPLPATDLKRLAAIVKEQILKEPEVESASVKPASTTTGIVTLFISIKIKQTGQQIDMPFKISSDSVVSL